MCKKAIDELKKMLIDANTNRLNNDQDDKWDGYIEGINAAIYRLEMCKDNDRAPVWRRVIHFGGIK